MVVERMNVERFAGDMHLMSEQYINSQLSALNSQRSLGRRKELRRMRARNNKSEKLLS